MSDVDDEPRSSHNNNSNNSNKRTKRRRTRAQDSSASSDEEGGNGDAREEEEEEEHRKQRKDVDDEDEDDDHEDNHAAEPQDVEGDDDEDDEGSVAADVVAAPSSRQAKKSKPKTSWAAHVQSLKLPAADDEHDKGDDDFPLVKSKWTFDQTLVAGKAPELFCRRCGSILPSLDGTLPVVECRLCHCHIKLSAVANRVLISRWRAASIVERQQVERALATIEKDCANPDGCDATQLSYYQQQLRSADEGATTFYECKKCGYKFSENA